MTNFTSDQLLATDLPIESGNTQTSSTKPVSKSSTIPVKSKARKKRQIPIARSSESPERAERKDAIEQWRKKDNRIWSDEEAVEFPKTFFYNLHREEWATKAELAESIRHYLHHEAKSVYSILEVGCGCGWFSHQLSGLTEGPILGIDEEASQIEQATRLFATENLTFRRGDFFQARLRKNSFDYIILMDTHQWLGTIEQIATRAKSLLTPGGELHILSSSLPSSRTIQKHSETFSKYCSDKLMDTVPQHLHWASKEDFFANGFEELNPPSLVSRLLNRKKTGAWMRLLAGRG